ncbi:hypothetical protein M011DRAFT_524504 [Sporormia fimetaria CBS 119925]|uniref:BYS1 domain protein n=1 Tax=Sporormia fimetaria CBS 119925 TaxID=1340428 RepID=A0A6A6VKZ7_9PLEO|nr:hypothetical protein M011DRAFT_524504 [Sporormia fimetaria CBS 119925]
MQLKSLLLTAALSLTALAMPTETTTLTSGVARVINNCPSTVYLWSVASTVGDRQTLQPGGQYSEQFRYDPRTGVAIKVGTTPESIGNGAPVLHFSYTLNNGENSIYYDVSSAFGVDPLFSGRVVKVVGDGPNVPSIVWTGPAPSGTRVYFGNTNLILTLCA